MYTFSLAAVDCPPLMVENGTVTLTGTNPGDVATYMCDSGFTLVGNQTRECLPTAMWEVIGEEPTCYSKLRPVSRSVFQKLVFYHVN